MKRMNVNGIEMAYEDRGQGDPVVLLHGFCGSSAYWDEIIPKLESKYRVIVPDLRGHGKTAVPEGTYSMEQMAEDIKNLLASLDVSEVKLLGHSLGGYVTLAFAEKYSDMLTGFGLIHSTGLPDDAKAKEGRMKGIETLETEGIEPFADNLVPKLFSSQNINNLGPAVEKTKAIALATDPRGAINTLRGMMERPDRTQVIASTNKAVLLVAGSDDGVIPPDKVFSAEQQLVLSETIENAGHMSMLEKPDELAGILDRFLDPAL
ncbi:alpha/beta fold hydrolase [Aneurinibacillus tyrosinisolvens]|uniref:alpha/beta fold hydrolase n=1 Tax=Aneurinibacillus tyrosinisolvens TaxID=1443435 RepID=UPI00063F72B0|nr:alpha/beta hydrolase [Aneurinibacillus tyrosinisolvens]